MLNTPVDDVNIHLDQRYRREWDLRGGIAVTGQVFRGQSLLRGKDLLDAVEAAFTTSEIEPHLRQWNGSFAVVARTDNAVYAAVDWMRSIPLFWVELDGQLWISDDAYWLVKSAGLNRGNEDGVNEFSTAGFVSGNDTLVRGLSQLQAGQYVRFDIVGKKLEVRTYDRDVFSSDKRDESMDLEQCLELLADAYRRLGARIVKVLDGRQAVVPLSGGYDSRCIVWMLRQQGYDQVLTFTYGRKGNYEAKVASEVAQQFDYPWEFVEYTPETWKTLLRSNDYQEFVPFADNMSVVPHPGDFAAFRVLRCGQRIDDTAVFLPGHTALAPSQVQQRFGSPMTWKNLPGRIQSMFYIKNRTLPKSTVRKLCKKSLNGCEPSTRHSAEQFYECWYWRNPETKYIFNSQRAIEFFGWKWFLPMADRELMKSYWTVPMRFYLRKYLFNKYVELISREISLPLRSARPAGWQKRVVKAGFKAIGLEDHLRRVLNEQKRRNHPICYFDIVPQERWSDFSSSPDSAEHYVNTAALGRICESMPSAFSGLLDLFD